MSAGREVWLRINTAWAQHDCALNISGPRAVNTIKFCGMNARVLAPMSAVEHTFSISASNDRHEEPIRDHVRRHSFPKGDALCFFVHSFTAHVPKISPVERPTSNPQDT